MSVRTVQRGPSPSTGVGRAVVVARGPLAVGGLTLAATAYIALVDPNSPGHYLTCPLLAATGLYCAGCGGLRAVHDLAHLDVAGAWGMNPLLVIALPFMVAAWVRWVVRAVRPGRATAASGRRSAWLAWAVLVVLPVYSVLRNVPALAPWLAP